MAGKQSELEENLPLVDAEEQLRTVLSNLVNHCASLGALNRRGNMGLETNGYSSLDPDDRQHWEDILETYTEDNHRLSKGKYCRNRRASNVPGSARTKQTQAIADYRI